ncbi:MAG: hypothetical protein OEW85_07805, partial [Acidimicrobiia bacterium]|nr:hypothetical protein [Acidimicrobiia bacterium]
MGALRVTIAAIAAVVVVAGVAQPVGAQDTEPTVPTTEPGFVNVIEISGLLDPVLANFIDGAIDDAEATGARHLVLQVNSNGSVLSEAALRGLADRIATSTVPVSIWIGPSGSQARGGTAQLAAVAHEVCLSPNSKIGDLGQSIVPDETLSAYFGDALSRLRDRAFGDDEAIDAGIVR